MADLNKNIAPLYDSTKSYDLGDVVNVDNKLYAYCGKADGFKEVYLADLVRGKAESKLNLEPVLLWENPNEHNAFAAQTLALDLSDYEGVIIENRVTNTTQYDSYKKQLDIIYKKDTWQRTMHYAEEGTKFSYMRTATLANDGITFSTCGYTTGSQYTTDDNMIPTRIWGFKGIIIEKKTTLEDAPQLLWTNPSPTASFSAQTIALDLSDYSGVIIESRGQSDSDEVNGRVYIKKSDNTSSTIWSIGRGDTTWSMSRKLELLSSGVKFYDTYNSLSSSISNNRIIPYKIYGVKTDIVEVDSKAPKLLWVNGSPTTDFEGQTVSLDLSGYKAVLVEFDKSITTHTMDSRIYCRIGEGEVGGGYTGYDGERYTNGRAVTATSSGVTISDGYSGSTKRNGLMIPTKIYGISEELVEYTETCEPLTEYLVEKGAEEDEVDTVAKIEDYLDENLGGTSVVAFVQYSMNSGGGCVGPVVYYNDGDTSSTSLSNDLFTVTNYSSVTNKDAINFSMKFNKAGRYYTRFIGYYSSSESVKTFTAGQTFSSAEFAWGYIIYLGE